MLGLSSWLAPRDRLAALPSGEAYHVSVRVSTAAARVLTRKPLEKFAFAWMCTLMYNDFDWDFDAEGGYEYGDNGNLDA